MTTRGQRFFEYSQKISSPQKALLFFFFFSPQKLARLFLLKEVTVMPTLPLLAGDLRFFASSPAPPALVHKSPSFYVHHKINIEYLVKNKTDLV